MIISQDGFTTVVDVKEACLLKIGRDVLLVVNGRTMGKFKNTQFAEQTFRNLLSFLATKGDGDSFEVPADF